VNLAQEWPDRSEQRRVVAERDSADVAEQSARDACLTPVQVGRQHRGDGNFGWAQKLQCGELGLEVSFSCDLQECGEVAKCDPENPMFGRCGHFLGRLDG